MKRYGRALAVLCSSALTTSPIPAFAGDLSLFLGNWVLNVEKSKFEPGPAPKSLTILTVDTGCGQVTSIDDRVDADGTISRLAVTYATDGKEYRPSLVVPSDAGLPPISFVNTQIDARTIRIEDRFRGKVMRTITATISEDGKTQTSIATGTTRDGKLLNQTLVFEKK